MALKTLLAAAAALAFCGGTAVAQGDTRRSVERSPLREDVFGAVTRSIKTRFPDAKVIPDMSAGATDGLYTRAAGIPTYGASALWTYVNEPLGVHGLNERLRADSFHDDIDHWERILRELAG